MLYEKMNTLRRWGFVLLMLAAWPVKRTAAWLRKASRWGFLMFVSFSALGSAPDLKVGDVPPDVFGKSSNGEAVHLSDYQGRIVVISFWATWCDDLAPGTLNSILKQSGLKK